MKQMVYLLGSIFLISIFSCNVQTQSTLPSTTSTTPEPLDACSGGKVGNPGAQFRLSSKALDSIYSNAIDEISRAIKSMTIGELMVPIAGGILKVRNTRVTEAKIAGYERWMIPPNRIRSRLYGARLVSTGDWSYRPSNGLRQLSSGLFRIMVVNAELNATKQLGRTWDAKPTIQSMAQADCKAYLGDFQVEIEGFGDNTTVINQCDNLMCKGIRSHFEDRVCDTVRTYVRDVINRKLYTVPTKINLGSEEKRIRTTNLRSRSLSAGNRFVLDYGLLVNEPKVTENTIQAFMKGEVSRGSGGAPFHANDLYSSNDGGDDWIVSFLLSDYVFNTLLYHAHPQQSRFSAFDNVQTPMIRDYLKLQCSSPSATTRSKGRGGRQLDPICLGSIFQHVISQSDEMGDLVFKTQRPLRVILSPNNAVFGVNGGQIEAYGPVGSDGKRELLGRADVQWIRGAFTPTVSGCNISGMPTIVDLKLTPAAPITIQTRRQRMSDVMASNLTLIAVPLLTETFRSFFTQYAQFPIPLIEGYSCQSPVLTWSQRTMRIDTDVRPMEATRGKN